MSKSTFHDVSALHHSFGQWIRNHYGLWDERHPLVHDWFAFPDKRDVRDDVDYSNVDYSEDHPDQVSTRVMEMVWKKLQPPQP